LPGNERVRDRAHTPTQYFPSLPPRDRRSYSCALSPAPLLCALSGHPKRSWSIMARHTTIFLVGAALGAGLLGTSSACAAPANGAAIGESASAGSLSQKVVWRGGWGGWRGAGWRGVGWRGGGWGWRGAGWRGVGWRGGWGWRGAGWRGGGWGWGWRPGLVAAGIATAGLATAAAYDYGYGDDSYYGWGPGWGVGYWRPGWRVGWGGWGPGWGGGWGWRPGWRVAVGW
jgi:hypothetical protein